MTKRHDDHKAESVWAPATIFAAFLTYLDVLRAYRRDDWITGGSVQWAGVAVGFLFYMLAIVLLAVFMTKLVRITARRSFSPTLSSMTATLLLIGILAAFSEVRGSFILVIALGTVVLAAVLGVTSAATRIPSGAMCASVIVAFIIGIIALTSNTYAFVLADRRLLITCSISLAATLTAGVIGIAQQSVTQNHLRAVMMQSIVLVCCIAPAGITYVREHVLPPAPDPRRPSLVLIVSDTLRADYCSVYGGHAATPALEGLAESGTVFESCYSLAPWTVPSMFGMFSSNYQPGVTPGLSREQGIEETLRRRFDPDIATLAELLADRGYATASLVGNSLLCDRDGINRGFQHMRLKREHWPYIESRTGVFGRMPFLHDALSRYLPDIAPLERIDLSGFITYYSRAFIKRQRGDPFFLWAHYMDPHTPYTPPTEYYTPPDSAPAILGHPDLNKYASLYSDEIRYVDACVGDILAELRAQNADSTTYVCVTSDHGEEFWEHGATGHGQSLYQELVRVPLIISGSNVTVQKVDSPVSGIDLMPTLAACLGIDFPTEWRGDSLAPLLRGETFTPRRVCFANANAPWRSKRGPLEMAVEDSDKLIRDAATAEDWLFNLTRDPGETADLSSSQTERTQHLHTVLDAWSEALPAATAGEDLEPLTPEEREQRLQELRALGYLN